MATKSTTGRKRRASGRTATRKIDLKGMVDEAKNPLLIVGGIFIGSQIAKVLDRSVTPSVNGLLGLSAVDGKQLVTPIILGAAGLIGAQLMPNRNLKMISYGVAGSGVAILAKNMLKVDVLPINGIDEVRKVIPGMGDALQLEEFPINGNEPVIAGDTTTDNSEEEQTSVA